MREIYRKRLKKILYIFSQIPTACESGRYFFVLKCLDISANNIIFVPTLKNYQDMNILYVCFGLVVLVNLLDISYKRFNFQSFLRLLYYKHYIVVLVHKRKGMNNVYVKKYIINLTAKQRAKYKNISL